MAWAFLFYANEYIYHSTDVPAGFILHGDVAEADGACILYSECVN